MRAWERQPGESGKAFAGFQCFRDLGPGRTLAAAADVYYDRHPKGTKPAPGQIKKWSVEFDWVSRAQALDDRDEEIRREAVELHELHRSEDHARRREALREANLANEERAATLETTYLERVAELMDTLPLFRQTTTRTGEDGRAVVYNIEPATKTPVLDAVRLHSIAARSEPTKIAPTTPGGLGEYSGGRDSDEEATEKVASIIKSIGLLPKNGAAAQQEPVDGG